jgi:hypothetical protein
MKILNNVIADWGALWPDLLLEQTKVSESAPLIVVRTRL